MSQETQTTEHDDILKRVIEREKAVQAEEEKKAFVQAELNPEKFGAHKETAEYLQKNGLISKIFERSPELELLAVGPMRDGGKLRDAVLKRAEELVALEEKEKEAERIKAELATKTQTPVGTQTPSDSPARPAVTPPPQAPQPLYATDKEFTKKLEEAGVSKGLIDLAALTGRDY